MANKEMDISTSKKKEEQFLLQYLVLDQISDNITVTDLNGIIKYVNKAECEMMSCSPEELIGKHVGIYGDVPVESGISEPIYEYARIQGSWRGEVYKFNKRGDKFFLDNRIRLVYDKNGKPVGMCCVSTDITERKMAEETLKQNEKKLREQNVILQALNEELYKSNVRVKEINEELFLARKKAEESDRLKSDFLANMSHEIRTPMNGILGFTSLLSRTDVNPPKQKLYVQIIEQSGHRMLGIINNIIDISKIESGLVEVIREETDLNRVFRGLYDFFRPEAENSGISLYLHTALPDDDCSYETDRQKLEQIISNLLKNAIKFTRKGQIDFGYRLRDTHLDCFVCDTGSGIDEDEKEKIFERFWRGKVSRVRKSDGTGLGLAITRSLTRLLGGDIFLESEKDKGSEFTVSFPLPAGYAADIKRKKLKAESATPGKESNELTVLIAEDDYFSAEYMKAILESRASKILIAENGVKAVELFRGNPDIDIILMDIKMPEMDGLEATRKIREFNSRIPIIAQTAFTLHNDRQRALEAGCNDYIAKPVKVEDLLDKIEKLL
jgi:PAS domain S-box-containing protein